MTADEFKALPHECPVVVHWRGKSFSGVKIKGNRIHSLMGEKYDFLCTDYISGEWFQGGPHKKYKMSWVILNEDQMTTYPGDKITIIRNFSDYVKKLYENT